jgi:hypothetical protein
MSDEDAVGVSAFDALSVASGLDAFVLGVSAADSSQGGSGATACRDQTPVATPSCSRGVNCAKNSRARGGKSGVRAAFHTSTTRA